MVNFGPLAAEIVSLVWCTPGNFNGFRVLAALLHGTLVVGVSQAAAFNRGRHLYSARPPSRWALAHISSIDIVLYYIMYATHSSVRGVHYQIIKLPRWPTACHEFHMPGLMCLTNSFYFMFCFHYIINVNFMLAVFAFT